MADKIKPYVLSGQAKSRRTGYREDVTASITVDWPKIIERLGGKALDNKSLEAGAFYGAIRVKIVRRHGSAH